MLQYTNIFSKVFLLDTMHLICLCLSFLTVIIAGNRTNIVNHQLMKNGLVCFTQKIHWIFPIQKKLQAILKLKRQEHISHQ